MRFLYRLMDKIFDPPPKNSDDAGVMLDEQTEDESYRRYKDLCYRNLILEFLLSLVLGLLVAHFLKL